MQDSSQDCSKDFSIMIIIFGLFCCTATATATATIQSNANVQFQNILSGSGTT